MPDFNICPNCENAEQISAQRCTACGTTLVYPTLGTLAFWILGDVDLTHASELARQVGHALGVPVTIQPGRLDPRPSERPNWYGRSGTVVLNQVLRRNQPGCLTNIALVGDNLVSSSRDNWLFGYAYVGWAAACMSFEPILADSPSFQRLMHRAKSICLHEIGHTLGLVDHTYDTGLNCCMLGEVRQDSLFLTDSYSSDFCNTCLNAAKEALRDYGKSIQTNRFVPDEGSEFAGRYKLLRFVGQGGMGTVWKAKDHQLDQNVALKFVATNAFDGPAEVRLLAEAAKARRLSHPNIVRVFDFVREAGVGCLIMDWIDGEDLERVRQSRPSLVFNPDEIRDWISQLCAALATAHGQGIIHQDIKPGNCLIGPDQSLTVLDFGIARFESTHVGSGLQSAGSGGYGTPGFSAPEQLKAGDPDISQDIFALGATIYSLLTGRPPRTHFLPNGLRVNGPLEPASKVRRSMNRRLEQVPATWERLLEKCLSLDPKERPKSAAAVAQALGVSLDGPLLEKRPPKQGFWRTLFGSGA